MEQTAVARAYYEALDEQDYERLATLLAPEFVQERPGLTLEGRERFVQFMREERPDSETNHVVESVFADGADGVAVEGRLLSADGTLVTTFVDVFAFDDETTIESLRTYTN